MFGTPARDPGPLPRPAMLRSGTPVVRRDAEHLQVGLDPPGRAVLPDRPEVRSVLDDLRDGLEPPAGPTAVEVCDALHRAGLLDDVDAARTRRQRLRRCRVGVEAPPQWRSEAETAIRRAELDVGSDAAVDLVVSAGEPDRERFDARLRDGRPHLVVRFGADRVVVGPYVVPGRTACLRCVDAGLADRDPRRPLVLAQLTRDAASTPPPDPLLVTWAIGWAARDLARAAVAETPGVWSATLTLTDHGDDAALPVHRPWPRHPHCGCAWDALELSG